MSPSTRLETRLAAQPGSNEANNWFLTEGQTQ
ncbi:hypothetical protein GGR33_003838 [Methylobacterium brachythecii]|uniref:Uncharacterized protein n=1 Tax=Methylobacterium brachythecii TaxID=1176177 RepID=A0A7W6AN72_9HYPH|nr:hypothetical protein [Methylobacterium brachythecii]